MSEPSSPASPSAEIPKAYEPTAVEARWYARWLESGCFTADPARVTANRPAFSLVIPPPNITGVLTLGHVLNNTIQDILARRARMTGHETLWLPGTDHAGLATQSAVEKALRKTEKVSRRDLGREEFVRRIWDWREKHGRIIIEQLKRLGCSCDWSRERFTLDADYAASVQRVFVDLYRKDYIYRDWRMVNWDPVAQTALSDEEVIPRPQKSILYYVKYEVVDQPGRFLEVATTRPETIMADFAVAVNPTDQRYQDLIGKEVRRPLRRGVIPVIADAAVDISFGTGALKITPAHDKLDFEIARRHGFDAIQNIVPGEINVIGPDGTIDCPAEPELNKLDRFVARKKAGEMLTEMGLISKEEAHENNVGFSERSEVPIEPRISEQWFLRYPKTAESLAVVRDGMIRFFPQHWEKVYAQWLGKIQDWCISRQVWWGHDIPAWTCLAVPDQYNAWPEPLKSAVLKREAKFEMSISGNGQKTIFKIPDGGSEDIFISLEAVTTDEQEGQTLKKLGFQRDQDTLDTWFSSWLWAYETMDPATRAKFYPTSVLVTAPDIIFFWVARMIIAGLEYRPNGSDRAEDNIPFRNVYFTGLIRDAKGLKMSKSLGNSPDVIGLLDKYGADGVRFGLLRIAPQGADIRFDEKQIEEGRNFANKIWNAARFYQMQESPVPPGTRLSYRPAPYVLDIEAKLRDTQIRVEAAYKEFRFSEMAQALYDFFWSDYCDWFVEAAKADILDPAPDLSAVDGSSEEHVTGHAVRKHVALFTMYRVLTEFLRLVHPYMPHLTEELNARLTFPPRAGASAPAAADEMGKPRRRTQFLMYQRLGDPLNLSGSAEEVAVAQAMTAQFYETIGLARNLRAEYNVATNKPAKFILRLREEVVDAIEKDAWGYAACLRSFKRMINAGELTLAPDYQPPRGTPSALTPLGDLFMPLAGLVSVDAERARIEKEIARTEADLQAAERKLASRQFVEHAPAEVVEEHRRRESDARAKLAKLRDMLAALEG